ncbi:MAG: hemerythrin domain-containing protein [Polyangiaceae bacterium]
MLAMSHIDAPQELGPRARLLADHEHLERLLRLLLIRARAGDSADVVQPWRELEEGLRAHLLAEEEELFPHYAAVAPDETAALRREHAEIRALLDAAGYGVELHTARLLMLEDLAERLREHASREDRGLYRFADARVSQWERLRARLHDAMHHLPNVVV